MKYVVDPDECIGCGLCENIAPSIQKLKMKSGGV